MLGYCDFFVGVPGQDHIPEGRERGHFPKRV